MISKELFLQDTGLYTDCNKVSLQVCINVHADEPSSRQWWSCHTIEKWTLGTRSLPSGVLKRSGAVTR